MFRLCAGSKPINLGCGLILLVVVLVEVWTLGESNSRCDVLTQGVRGGLHLPTRLSVASSRVAYSGL